MLVLKNREHTVPDMFRYTHETGYVSKAMDWWTWQADIKAHRKANNLPPISPEQAEAQLCEIIPPDWCHQEQAGRKSVNSRLGFRQIAEGFKAYMRFPFGNAVSQEEANRRARICSGCYMRVQPQGCGTCVKIAQLITGELAQKKTLYDSNLVNKACAVCRCPTQSIVHFPLDILEKVDNDAQQEAFPMFCWRKKAGENYAIK